MRAKSMLMIAATLAAAGTVLGGSNPCEISTAQELADLSVECFSSNATVTLTADLDFSGVSNFAPLGSLSTPFRGTFDGQGHTIKNLKINTEQFKYIGLFGVVSESSFQNFTIEYSCHFYSDASDLITIGSVVAFSEGGIKMNNVVNNGNVKYNGTSKVPFIGGLIGIVHSHADKVPGPVILYQCHNLGAVLNGGGHTGGIVGFVSFNGTDSLLDIEECTNDGIVTNTGNHTLASVGGILGKLSVLDDAMPSFILHCTNYGGIGIHTKAGITTTVGGILGAAELGGKIKFSVVGCINEGALYARTASFIGGIAGYLYSHHERVYAFVMNSVNRGRITLDYTTKDSTNAYLGGITGYTYTTKRSATDKDGTIHVLNCLNAGDLITTYDMAYAGGITGRLFPFSSNSTHIVNCLNTGLITPVIPALKLYNSGGLTGFALSASGKMEGHLVFYSYYPVQNGAPAPETSIPYICNTSSYDPRSGDFTTSVKVEGKEYFNIVSALNAVTSFDEEDAKFLKWTILSYNTNGGGYIPSQPEIMLLDHISVRTPFRYGGTFLGWFTDEALTTPLNISALTPNIHPIYAKWNMSSSTISFYGENKKLIKTESGECGSPIPFPSVKAPKGKELQWVTEDGSPFKFTIFLIEDVSIYVSWVEKSAAASVAPVASLLVAFVALFLLSYF